jgi:hypothetical protein
MRLGSFVYQVTRRHDFAGIVTVLVRRWRVIDADALTLCVTRHPGGSSTVAVLERKDAHESLEEATIRRSALAALLRIEGKTVTEETRIDEDY